MKVLVSACLLGYPCKYNGGTNYNEILEKMLFGHEVIAVCPEVMGGLPTPRAPVELKEGVAINADGVNVDDSFRKGAKLALERARNEKVSIAVLQSRSPSCGVNQIYDGSFSGKLIEGHGIFAGMLMKEGICVRDISEVEKKGLE